MKKYIVLIIIMLLCSCGRWKTTKFKSDKLFSIKSGSGPGNIMLNYNDNEILDISFRIKLHQGNIYIADNIQKKVQVFKKDGTLILVIEAKNAKSSVIEGIKSSNFRFSIIDAMEVDSKGNIYIQNRFTSSRNKKNSFINNNMGFSPSYIIVFDENGNLLYTLGKQGTPDIPFDYIDKLEIDKENRLFVISRSFDAWSVFRFTRRKMDFNIDFRKIDLKDEKHKNEYNSIIENIKINRSGDYFLIAVAYYKGSSFKYRKIYNYSIRKRRIDKTIMSIPEAKNELFSMINDKYLYLWDVEDNNVKFIVCDINGDIINNILIQLPERNESFREILIDESGKFYSYYIDKNGMDIFEWR